MSIITNLKSGQQICLNRIVHLISRDQLDSAVRFLELNNNDLGEELNNKILQIISHYEPEDIKKRIYECKSEQEAYKILIPDEPCQAVLTVSRILDLSNHIASFIMPITSLAPTPINSYGCFQIDRKEAIFIQLKRKKSLSLEEAKNYQKILGLGSFVEVLKYCPVLTHIDMRHGLNEGTNELLFAIATFCPHLESIDLFHCSGFTGKGISELVAKCPKLTSINLGRTASFNFNSVLLAIAESHTVEHINLTWCNDGYTYDALKNLVQKCTQLKSINLSSCFSVSDALLATITENCPHLSSINLVNCVEVTEEGLVALRERNPHLTIFWGDEINAGPFCNSPQQ